MDDRAIEGGQKNLQVSGPWINGTAALTKTQVLAINMFITSSTPLSRRNDTLGTHKTFEVVWEQAKFDAIIREKLGGNQAIKVK